MNNSVTLKEALSIPEIISQFIDDDKNPYSKIKKNITDKKIEYIERCKYRIKRILDEIPESSSINVKKRVIFGKPGHSIHVFAKSSNPDLLLVNSPEKNLGILDRLFPHDLEYLLEDLPCNLLITHSRDK